MGRAKYSLGNFLELGLPVLVLAILLLFTYAKLFKYPYVGFHVNSDGVIRVIFVQQDQEPKLQVQDRIIQIDSLRWEDYESDYRKVLLENARSGDTLSLVVERA